MVQIGQTTEQLLSEGPGKKTDPESRETHSTLQFSFSKRSLPYWVVTVRFNISSYLYPIIVEIKINASFDGVCHRRGMPSRPCEHLLIIDELLEKSNFGTKWPNFQGNQTYLCNINLLRWNHMKQIIYFKKYDSLSFWTLGFGFNICSGVSLTVVASRVGRMSLTSAK